MLKVVSLMLMTQLYLAASQNCIRNEVLAALKQAGSPVPSESTDLKLESVEKIFQEGIYNLSSDIRSELKLLLSPIVKEVEFLRSPGKSPCHPARSCKEIYEYDVSTQSGYFWLQSSSVHLIRVYCDMEHMCNGERGWMRVSSIDMSNTSHSCPRGLKTLLQPKRLCSMNLEGAGCSSTHLKAHGVEYSKVCGKIIGYQQKSPDAFNFYNNNRGLTIDDNYVDGISLTHGRHPRHHIWTFAAALHEITSAFPKNLCPCTNIHNPVEVLIPPFVGNDYFCDTASSSHFEFRFYPYDPLWDGDGCGILNTCCSFNRPPWFMRELPKATTENIELRLCANSGRIDEDITFEKLDIYIQ